MKNNETYLSEAKEKVVIQMNYENWLQLTGRATPIFMEDVLNQTVLLSLQSLRADMEKEIEYHSGNALDNMKAVQKLQSQIIDAERLAKISDELYNEQIDKFKAELSKAKQTIAAHELANSLLIDNKGEEDLANKIFQLSNQLSQVREEKENEKILKEAAIIALKKYEN